MFQQKIFSNISSKIFVARTNILGLRQFSGNKEVDKEISNTKENEDKNDEKPKEFNGPKGPEPTRYGDWERKGRVSDF